MSMENNAGYPDKSAGGQHAGEQFSTLNTGNRGEINVIGLGLGGARAALFTWNQWVKGRFTVVTDPQNVRIPEGIRLIPFCSPGIKVYSGRMGEFSMPDMEIPLLLPEELNQLLNGDGRLILLAGLGGYAGTKMAEALSLKLHRDSRDFTTLCSLPFRFEGRSRSRIAREAMERMKTMPNCHFFELDKLCTENPGLLLSEAFRAGDGAFFRMMCSIL